jgi:hypothetical protein
MAVLNASPTSMPIAAIRATLVSLEPAEGNFDDAG